MFVSLVSKIGVQVVTLGGMAVLARLLAPGDFGLMAMVMAVVGIGHLFRDFGLSAAAVRAKSLSNEQINSLFWINSGLGLLAGIAVFAVAPLVSSMYQDPRLLDVTRICAVLFFLAGVSAQPMALIRRDLQFSRLALVTVAAALAGQAAGIAAALEGAAYWSLVISSLVTAVTTLLLSIASSGIRIGWPALRGELRSLLNFGGHMVGFALMGFVALNAHNLILGLYQDATQVGTYHMAFMTMSLLFGQIAGPLALVVTPALARLQDQVDAYIERYLDSVGLIAAYSAALSAILFVCAPDIVSLFLGAQWGASVTILKLLALGLLPQALCNSTAWLYMSHGDTRAVLRWGIFGWGGLTIVLLLAAPAGAAALAMAYSAGMLLLLVPCLIFATRRIGLHYGRILRASVPALLSALLASPALLAPVLWLAEWSALARLAVSVTGFSLLYLGILTMLFRQWRILRQLLPQLRKERNPATVGDQAG